MGTIVPSPPGSQPMDTSSERVGTLLNQTTVSDVTGTDLDVTSMATARLTIIPVAYSATITFYASADGVNFDVIRGYKQGTTTVATSLALSSSSTASIWEFPVAGLKKLRIITSSSSGTSINIVGRASPIPSVEPIGVTLSSAVLAAGSALIGGVNVVDSAGTNKAGVDAQHAQLVTSGGTTAVSVASAAPGAVKGSAGRLCKVIITTLGTGSQIFYDNASAASGTILFATAASAPVGTIYDVQSPAANGIYAAGAASTPVCTVLYS